MAGLREHLGPLVITAQQIAHLLHTWRPVVVLILTDPGRCEVYLCRMSRDRQSQSH